MADGNSIVRMRGVSKWFKKTRALDKVDLDIPRGTIIGLLGANGAGKSTLLRHTIGLYLPDEGEITTFGTDAAKLTPKELARIGYVHQEGELLDWMTVRQLIRYVSAYYDNWNHELETKFIDDFEISLKDRVGAMSPGQRQRLAILLAIAFEPELLILDEPAAALDPIARSQFLDLLLEMIQDRNRTIIISSHILSDIEKVIDHALIMHEGRILRDCTFDSLREEFLKVMVTSLDGELPPRLNLDNVIACERKGANATLAVRNYTEEDLEAWAQEHNCKIEARPLPLEDIYRIVINQVSEKK
ncbi:MAG: ABC transporter ATP-binding protein [Candidatus Abyssobacteria bacterium SURF_17]|jgi:ABC-2 type transport system ATP-binding protein|uniref:ABC transporter ATP-binding protein n=1 Tax=Candidatus Abyssobacteria bacterium SURF_17 TaxID=2093361 RepID=A0A419FA62_9BACT|nr:MAG: ABC transporter ATP-binding protein [Candidatus Abyssubacteria bacterium SURF_17]